ncbi:hypothetical protein SAMN06313540_11212 [Epsilonproteobacteria bacterium SCGC AD-308-E02]|nr:hypothetical protein SAMN06313540_11212 [Epsilonproteobacteria bacterium SCGC AD-308-E02]
MRLHSRYRCRKDGRAYELVEILPNSVLLSDNGSVGLMAVTLTILAKDFTEI